MLTQVLDDLIRKQRPYYTPTETPIKGLNNQYWIIFKHRDADNLLHNIVSFFGLGEKHSTYKLLRIDLNHADIYEYVPKHENNIPNTTLIRTRNPQTLESFLDCINITTEPALLVGSFLEINIRKRRQFSLPTDQEKYDKFIRAYLERTKLYRRSTAYFSSGVLKFYQEPLQSMIKNEGEIRLLMDWQGFTNKQDVKELQKLHDPQYRSQYIKRTFHDFLQGLEDDAFTSTQILAELVRLDILKIKLVKMEGNRNIYHKKIGILTDHLDNSIQHNGSDNFTKNAHNGNAESIIFFYWDTELDHNAIIESIEDFDDEWFNSPLAFDLTADFLEETIKETQRRIEAKCPIITKINPHQLEAGQTQEIIITGNRLKPVQNIIVKDDTLIQFNLKKTTQKKLTLNITISPDHPPQTIEQLILTTDEQTYITHLSQPLEISQPLTLPDFPEIEGFKQAIAQLLNGNYGTPEDFLYYLAQQKPHLWQNLQLSAILDQLVDEGVLFEHQKSGAQQCQRIMKQFGVAVCADAVGLGKTRLGAAVCKLFREENGQAKIAIIAAKKLHDNWKREMAELGFRSSDYELYNKNLMSRKGNFLDDFNRYGGPDVVLIDEAHEGIRNYSSRIHKTCLKIREKDRQDNRERYFLLLTATPWNNRRDDIYNILSPFLTRPEGFKERNFPPELIDWFNNRDIGVESFTDNTDLFRQVYKELFLQRTRKMLKSATPDLNLYAKRQAVWLPVTFEPSTEQALEQIFTEFESSLYIPSADPVRYLKGSTEKRSLLGNQRRFFLQRAESSMYALKLTIKNFSRKTQLVKERLLKLEPNADGLHQFLLWHYDFEKETEVSEWDDLTQNLGDEGSWEADEFEEEEEEIESDKEERRQQLRKSIELAIEDLRNNADEAQRIYNQIIQHCDYDLTRLADIQALLETEFIQDHKREEVTNKVRELVSQGHKVLLISTFSDTVLDYYQYMTQDTVVSKAGIGMAVGGSKRYYNNGSLPKKFSPHNYHKQGQERTGIKRQSLFKLFAPEASIKEPSERPKQEQQLQVLIGSETLSVGQNLQDADYLINIDVPYNPMTLEQRIGRIDRPKQHSVDTLTIYYANSENQLLRQASRLKNLNKKLVGTITEDGFIPPITSTKDLGASVYGDTLFDDEILPDYINFLESLVKARQIEQENLQEKVYNKQENTQKTYSQNEILYSEELAKLVRKKGFDYQPNTRTLGTGNDKHPHTITILTVDYFGPNGEPISDQQETLYWNDLTEENDGYGQAIVSAFTTPDFSEVVSVKNLIEQSKILYKNLILLKQERQEKLAQPETVDNINITSERISRIQKRIQSLSSLPEGIDVRTIRGTLKKLNQNKTKRTVQKLLKDYTDGNKSELENLVFIKEFINETARLSLIDFEGIKAVSFKITINGVLFRV